MKKIKVAINGFGRIGRMSLRAFLEKDNIALIAINDLADPSTLVHLLKYDSTYGRFSGTVDIEGNRLILGGHKIELYAEAVPKQLPWKSLGVDIVLEATGQFRDLSGASQHIQAGARQVVISAPTQDDIPTIVLGINEHTLCSNEPIISNASCTTYCVAPMAKVLDDHFGIEKGYINTIHAYTADQRLQDAPHKDLRRARAAAKAIIPTTTNAAKTVGLVLPHLQGKLDGMAMRVPVVNGSVTDFTVILKKPATKAAINAAMKEAAEGLLQGILAYTEDPIVSVDIIGDPHSCTLDAQLTATQGYLAKVVGWYDNEMGYAHRIAELICKLR